MNRASAVAALPLLLLVGAAAFESLRPLVMVLLLLGLVLAVVLARRVGRGVVTREAMAFAACLVVALNLAWDGVPLSALIRGMTACADLMAPFAALRVVGALLVLACVGVLMRLMRGTPGDIGLCWPSRGWLILSLIAVPVVGAAAILIGPRLAEPFFGPLSSPTIDPRGLVPAIGFALANATMEEVAYRGALLRWLTPFTGVATALAFQALIFGLAHGVGTDFIGSPLPVMAATATTGLVLGALALRTRSLLLPIAIHVALDIPVFYGKVCLGL
ncbi:MAG: CPBP family intramembrane glutamic endopeptidase [Candidatus Limnocylindria bacterium]